MDTMIDNKVYQVDILRKNNRNTYIRVKNGRIVVTTNYLTTKSSINKLIHDNEASIIKMINADSKRMAKEDKFYYFGREYRVIYGFQNVSFDHDRVYALNKQALGNYIKSEITKIYQERLDYWYQIFTEDIPKPILRIRKMTSRWGVCNIRSHVVTLNYNLVNYDITCLDYVIVHELSHFIYHDHQKGFWSLVSKYYPRYKDARKMLKE